MGDGRGRRGGGGAGGSADTSWIAAVLARPQYARTTIHNAIDRFAGFQQWCVLRGLGSLPADPDTVRASVEEITLRYRPSTVRLRVEVIRKVHRLMDHASLTAALAIRMRVPEARACASRGRPGPTTAIGRMALGLTAAKALRGACAPKTLRHCITLVRPFEVRCEGGAALPATRDRVAAYAAGISRAGWPSSARSTR